MFRRSLPNEVVAVSLNVSTSLFSFSALNLVYQRNGDGEAKSPACRAGVCEAVLHTVKQGTRLPSQVKVILRCEMRYVHVSIL